MKVSTFLNTTVAAASLAVLAASVPASAQSNQYNVCIWEEIPGTVLSRIVKRSDFQEILTAMFEACPEAALGLTDWATATIDDPAGPHDWQGGEDGDDDPTPVLEEEEEEEEEEHDEEEEEHDEEEEEVELKVLQQT